MAESGSAAWYRAIKDGNWNDPATWEASTDSGNTWAAATGYPGDTYDTTNSVRVQDTVYSLTDSGGKDHTVIYNVDMSDKGSVTFDDANVVGGKVVLPDADPTYNLEIVGGLLKNLNFDLSSKNWIRKITIITDTNIKNSPIIGEKRNYLVYRVVADNSDTQKVVTPYDVKRRKDGAANGDDIETGDIFIYDYNNKANITAVNYDPASGQYTISLDTAIAGLSGKYVGIKDDTIKIIHSGLKHRIDNSILQYVYFEGTGGSSSPGGYTGLGYYKNSILNLYLNGGLFLAYDSFINNVYNGSGYAMYYLSNSYAKLNIVNYFYPSKFYNSIIEGPSTVQNNIIFKNIRYNNSLSLTFNTNDKAEWLLDKIEGLTSLSFPLVNYIKPIYWHDIEVNGVLKDFILYRDSGYLLRTGNNWEAIGGAYYGIDSILYDPLTNKLSFSTQSGDTDSHSGTAELYVNGALVQSFDIVYDTTQKTYSFSYPVKAGDSVEVLISVPDGCKLWTDAIEKLIGGGKFKGCEC